MVQQIIQQVLAGDKHAFASIINQYKNPLYATILRMTKNPEMAKDLVQEAFIKVYKQLDKYDQLGSFSSWLYKVAINHCMDVFRTKSFQMQQVEINDEQMVNENHPEVIFLKKEKSRQLEKLIARLPDNERIIVLLKYANELTYSEISEILNIPLSDVRNKLHRAKKKLRIMIEQQGGEFNVLSEGR